MNKTEYEAMIDKKLASVKEELIQEFKEEKKEAKYPKDGTIYYYISSYGDVCWIQWIGSDADKKRFAIGNYFETREEAEFQAERLKVIAELKRFAEKDRAWDGINRHWYFCYDFNSYKLEYFVVYSIKEPGIYFASEEDAKKAIKTVGEDRIRRFYLGVEE